MKNLNTKAARSIIVAAIGLFTVNNVMAKDMTEKQARSIIAPFYKNLSVPQGDVATNIKNSTTTDWQSCVNNTNCRGQEESIKQFIGYAQATPDMQLTIKEVITRGNKIVVRNEFTGTPAGEFLGVPHTGKSYKAMSIDIHTIKNNKISHTNHLEDWMGVVRQLKAK
ncbi:MAG: ester cyclase [Formosimonas sp.]